MKVPAKKLHYIYNFSEKKCVNLLLTSTFVQNCPCFQSEIIINCLPLQILSQTKVVSPVENFIQRSLRS